ncbi:hypothetical protein [Neobacillus mesonae]|uniref:Uncharacterized protein n=1 Tax=Neobacillus mesonae TaxID=1193713 RepID=A0A3Q9R225_9BACI|nr:hypothetical protein [Neobacillus mesonae]AZU64531.1 hypothetical protein CHR53_26700 [Neobacillus mesonae]MED4202947.1 hypothetical protein [Neobacillus mesonae]
MHFNEKESDNLEQLLESLIKMVGKANKNVDSLQKRVSQLEWIVREHQIELRERGPVKIYGARPHKRHEKVLHHS